MRKILVITFVLVFLTTNLSISSLSASEDLLQEEEYFTDLNEFEDEFEIINDDTSSENYYSDPLSTLLRKIEVFDDSNNQNKQRYIVKLKKSEPEVQNINSLTSTNVTNSDVFDAVTLELSPEQVNHIINYRINPLSLDTYSLNLDFSLYFKL